MKLRASFNVFKKFTLLLTNSFSIYKSGIVKFSIEHYKLETAIDNFIANKNNNTKKAYDEQMQKTLEASTNTFNYFMQNKKDESTYTDQLYLFSGQCNNYFKVLEHDYDFNLEAFSYSVKEHNKQMLDSRKISLKKKNKLIKSINNINFYLDLGLYLKEKESLDINLVKNFLDNIIDKYNENKKDWQLDTVRLSAIKIITTETVLFANEYIKYFDKSYSKIDNLLNSSIPLYFDLKKSFSKPGKLI